MMRIDIYLFPLTHHQGINAHQPILIASPCRRSFQESHVTNQESPMQSESHLRHPHHRLVVAAARLVLDPPPLLVHHLQNGTWSWM